MHLRQVKGYVHLFIIFKTYQLQLDFFIVKEGEFVFSYFDPLAETRILIQIIIFTEIALV